MQFLITVLQSFFTAAFFRAAVMQGIPLLYGAVGEILTEKSGNLNLGIAGIMYMGAIGGLVGSFLYAKSQGWDTLASAKFACAAGSVAVEHVGANTAIRSKDQVLARMNGQ